MAPRHPKCKPRTAFIDLRPKLIMVHSIILINSSEEYVRATLQALAAIGAVATCALLERAVAIGFPDGYPADAQQHQECLADFDDIADALNPLDLTFFEYPEPLVDLVND